MQSEPATPATLLESRISKSFLFSRSPSFSNQRYTAVPGVKGDRSAAVCCSQTRTLDGFTSCCEERLPPRGEGSFWSIGTGRSIGDDGNGHRYRKTRLWRRMPA